MTKLEKGLVQVFTGNGKGKTSASLGIALRAVGQGLSVYMIQFMKSGETGEMFAIKKYLPKRYMANSFNASLYFIFKDPLFDPVFYEPDNFFNRFFWIISRNNF